MTANRYTNDEFLLFDDETNAAEVLQDKLADAEIPGAQIEFDPDEAEKLGAFVEDALSEEDALDASPDLAHEPQPLEN